jgi:hypothetical protein
VNAAGTTESTSRPRVGGMEDFTGRDWLPRVLCDWLESGERLRLLIGPPGLGKSILTAWLEGPDRRPRTPWRPADGYPGTPRPASGPVRAPGVSRQTFLMPCSHWNLALLRPHCSPVMGQG